MGSDRSPTVSKSPRPSRVGNQPAAAAPVRKPGLERAVGNQALGAALSAVDDPRLSPGFIDAVLEETRCRLIVADRYTLVWKGGRVVVPNAEIDWTGASRALPLLDVHPDKASAMAAAAAYLDIALATGYDQIVTYYRAAGGAVLPTWFSPETAPETYAAIMGVNAQVRESAGQWEQEFRGMRNSLVVGAVLGGVLRFTIRMLPGGGGGGAPEVPAAGPSARPPAAPAPTAPSVRPPAATVSSVRPPAATVSSVRPPATTVSSARPPATTAPTGTAPATKVPVATAAAGGQPPSSVKPPAKGTKPPKRLEPRQAKPKRELTDDEKWAQHEEALKKQEASGRSSGRVVETYKTPEAAVGQVEGKVTVTGKVDTVNADLRAQGYTKTWYVTDGNGVRWTVHHNPRTGTFTGAHPSSLQ